MADPIQFVNDDPVLAVNQAVARYEAISGRTLGAADPERLVVSAIGMHVSELRSQLNTAANQNLLRFATGAALEEKGYGFGVFRLDAAPARCVLEFTISGTGGSVYIPAGTRVKSRDGAVMFATDEDVTSSGTDPRTVQVNATCTVNGVAGNEYAAGQVNVIVDPIAYVSAATNVDTTTGGSDEETDDQLRARIPLANATFSVAGPTDAYIYFAKTADAGIVDVNIPDPTPTPGTMYIYPLLADGVIPGSAVLDAVAAVCSDKKVRPMCDTVVVAAPTEITYSLLVQLILKRTAPAGTATLVAEALSGFVNQWGTGIGRLGVDVVVEQIKAKCMLPGVYSVGIPSLPGDISVAYNEFARCTGIVVNVASIVDEP